MSFDFEKLKVFDKALDAAEAVDVLVQAMPYSRRRMKDQVGRAADSFVLNIAEGSGEFALREKARFYRIARRSVAETAGALRLAVRYRIFPASRIDHAMKLLDETAAMLTTMCNNLSRRAQATKRRRGEGPTKIGCGNSTLTASPSARPRPAR